MNSKMLTIWERDRRMADCMKKCSKCQAKKDETEFAIRADTGKPRRQCKDCFGEKQYLWREANRGVIKSYGKYYRSQFPERTRAKQKRWRDKQKAGQ
jgi:hypothetical protein